MIIKDYKDDKRWEGLPKDRLTELNVSPSWYLTALFKTVDSNILKNYNIAIETGTFEGYSTIYFAEIFNKVYTVEKYVKGGNMYTNKNLTEEYKKIKDIHNNVEFFEGDSPKFLEQLLPTLDEPAFILLDAHAHQHTPVREELETIKKFSNTKDHIIMIDDTLDIDSMAGNWPSQFEIIEMLKDINPQYDVNFTEYGRRILVAHELSK